MKLDKVTYKLGFDIGGTFTDFILLNENTGRIYSYKLLTTPKDPSEAVIYGIKYLINEHNINPNNIVHTTHATTLITNAFIERKGSKTALICTSGFSDIIEIGNEMRYDIYDLLMELPEPIVSRNNRYEIDERITANGNVYIKINLAQLNKIVNKLNKSNIESVGICFLHSYKNNTHENKVKEIIKSKLKNICVSVSNEVSPGIREYERISTTLCNAYVQPLVSNYLNKLVVEQKKLNITNELSLMLSSGGITDIQTAIDYPINLVESGPAAGVLSSIYYGKQIKEKNILSFDMGGTTAKGALIRDGRAIKEYHQEIARVHGFKAGSGLPVKAPVIDMIEIGAGGGSIAAPDVRGAIAVGPRSAGAEPGPACYGQGGSHATLTDANLSLGYLDPDFFLGGEMNLDKASAVEAINRTVGVPLELPHDRAAWGIHEIINEDVARAFRIHASERGFDYRNSTMIAFGGSGPVHAMGVARKLGIPRVIFPFAAGVMSALGLLASPLTFEVSRTRQVFVAQVDADDFEQTFKSLEEEAQDPLRRAAGEGEVTILRRLDMRYHGQGHEIEVEVPLGVELENLPDLFRETYKSVYGASLLDAPLVITTWKVEATLPTPSLLTVPPTAVGEVVTKGERLAYFDTGFVETPVYDRYQLAVDTVILGPALIEERESTVVIGPGDRAQVDRYGNLVAEREKAP